MVQIESITAVENAEAILSTPGVDGCWTGPADLAYSMGIHPRDQRSGRSPRSRALERIMEACANTGKIPGIAAMNPEDAADRAAEGWRFINAGADYQLLHGRRQNRPRDRRPRLATIIHTRAHDELLVDNQVHGRR